MRKNKKRKFITSKDVLNMLEKKFPGFKKEVREEFEKLKIAYRIVELRHRKQMSQKELGRRIGMEQSNIARMERADYRDYKVSTLQKIAKATGSHLTIKFS